MAKDLFQYDRMVQDALRRVVREALARSAEHGLPGNHHFFVTFRTDHPGVNVPDYFRAEHPYEMTIVLQHQFWDLEVGAEAFAVTVSFNNAHERITVPLAAVTRFVDPSVSFGVQFQAVGPDGTLLAPPPELPAAGKAARETADKPEDKEGGASDKVIALDAFRKT